MTHYERKLRFDQNRKMAIVCPQCGQQYDITLFGFGKAIRCACGAWVDLNSGHVQTLQPNGAGPNGFLLSSPAFVHGGRIPKRYTADGADVSPPLQWKNVPEHTAELVLVCEDPDAPTARPWVHWLVYKISAEVTELPENLPPLSKVEHPVQLYQGRNSWHVGRTVGYRGPAPPLHDAPHRYVFCLFALKEPLTLGPGTDRDSLIAAMSGLVLAQAVLVGMYGRQN